MSQTERPSPGDQDVFAESLKNRNPTQPLKEMYLNCYREYLRLSQEKIVYPKRAE